MSQRVSFTKITLEYFEIDLEHNYMKPEQNARRRIDEDPSKHQLGAQQIGWICTGVREHS